jgi:hypothetical protein
VLTRRNLFYDCFSSTYLGKAVLGAGSHRMASCAALRLGAAQLVMGLGLSALLFAQTASQPSSNSSVFHRGHEFYIDNTFQPTWAGKFLVQVQDRESKSPSFELADHEGNKERVVFQLPDTAYIEALRYNVGTDGSIVAIGTALRGKNGGACFIAWIAPDRKRQTVIQAAPFVPVAVAMAADGTIWSIGTLFDDDKMKTMANNVMQRYDTSGRLLTSLTLTELRSPREWPGDATEFSYLQASQDRVGWFTSGDQYLEFSLAGAEIGRFEGPVGWGAPATPV